MYGIDDNIGKAFLTSKDWDKFHAKIYLKHFIQQQEVK